MKAHDFRNYINSDLCADLIKEKAMKPITTRTAQRWLAKLDYRYGLISRKGFYYDGHERDDVVKYRQEFFLPIFLSLNASAPLWINDGRRYRSVDDLPSQVARRAQEKQPGKVGPRPLTRKEERFIAKYPAAVAELSRMRAKVDMLIHFFSVMDDVPCSLFLLWS